MLSAWKKLLFRVQGEFSVQCFGGDAEQLGRLSLVSAGSAERAFDGLTFGFGQRHGSKIGGLIDDVCQTILLKIFCREIGAGGEHGETFPGQLCACSAVAKSPPQGETVR